MELLLVFSCFSFGVHLEKTILLFFQVLLPDMSLATVRAYIWKKSDDLILNYRVVQPRWFILHPGGGVYWPNFTIDLFVFLISLSELSSGAIFVAYAKYVMIYGMWKTFSCKTYLGKTKAEVDFHIDIYKVFFFGPKKVVTWFKFWWTNLNVFYILIRTRQKLTSQFFRTRSSYLLLCLSSFPHTKKKGGILIVLYQEKQFAI